MIESALQRYRGLLTRQRAVWVLAATSAKLPIAMASLSMVFLMRQSPAGYAWGSVLAAAYVAGEVLGAAVQARWLLPRRLRRQVAMGLLVGAVAFGGLVLARTASPIVLAGIALVAGAGPAASPGALRTILTATVQEVDVAAALSADTMLTSSIWAVAPAVVVLLALTVAPAAPLALGALSAAAASVLVLALPTPPANGEAEHRFVSFAELAAAWPIYLSSAAAMALVAATELVLPALLEYRHISVGWSGPLLTGFAVFGAIGAFCYGLRAWPGNARSQSIACLLATGASLTIVALAPGPGGIAFGLLAAALFRSAVLVTRNLSLRERLPERVHAAGYSMMYAVQGVGYSMTAALVAVVLARSGPVPAVLGGAVAVALLAGLSALMERQQTWARSRSRLRRTASTPERRG